MTINNRLLLPLLALLLVLSLSACAASSDDGRLITGEPREYLLKPEDLPEGGSQYFIPENEAFILPNEAAVGAFGKELGETLVAEEERVTGWRVHYEAVDPEQSGPQVYLVTITQHQSAKGAQTAVEKYNYARLYPEGGWTVEETDLKLGDRTVVESGPTEDRQGRRAMNYRIEFAYRNMSVDVLVFGLVDEVSLSTAEKAARAVLARLQAAPLGEGPIPTPTRLVSAR